MFAMVDIQWAELNKYLWHLATGEIKPWRWMHDVPAADRALIEGALKNANLSQDEHSALVMKRDGCPEMTREQYQENKKSGVKKFQEAFKKAQQDAARPKRWPWL